MMGDNPEDLDDWTPLKLTLVHYPKGDTLGKALAFMSLTPFFIALLHFGFFCVIRDFHSLFYGIGTIVNYVLNIGLKSYFKESRPEALNRSRSIHHNEYGMPSTHAQFMAFYTFYMCLFVLFRLYHTGGVMETMVKVFWILFQGIILAAVAFGRVYLVYHTVEQVAYGVMAGVIMAIIWFGLTQKVFTPFFPTLASWRISELLGMSDLTKIPNVGRFLSFSLRSEAIRRHKQKRK